MNANSLWGGLFAALLFVSQGCGSARLDPASEAGKLAVARGRWAASGIRSYRFTVTRSAFVAPGYGGPARVTVTNGVVTSVEPAGEKPVAKNAFDDCDTIEELFGKAQSGVETPGAIVNGDYDPLTGVPKSIAVDPIPLAADDEATYFVADFTAI